MTCVLLESGSDCSESLDVVEVDLDQVTLSVRLAIQSHLLLAIGMRAYDWSHLPLSHLGDDFVRVVTCVGNERLTRCVFPNDLCRYRGLVLLARREFEVERATFGVDECMELRGEATSRVPQCIEFDPPFPPEASWCARTTEASIMQPSSSASS